MMVTEEAARLLEAARNGDLANLSSEKVSDSLADDQGATCLHYAARGGCLSAVEFLVNTKGLNPRKRTSVGATPLHDAAATGNLEVLKWLLDHSGIKVDDQDGTGATVTHLAARYGHTQTLEWLLDETDCEVLKRCASGALPLHFAAEGGHLECVKLLVAENPRSINMQMSNGSTPAYLACQKGQLPVAEFLATKNGTPKIHTFDGMSPLHAAAQTGQLPIVKWLVKDQGLNPNERDFDGATPLHYAASRGNNDVVVWLMKEGGARIVLDNLGGSPLHSAAEFGQHKVLLSLLQNGCSADITDNQGLTAEELAEKCGQTTAVAILRGEIKSLPDSEPASPVKSSSTQQPQLSQGLSFDLPQPSSSLRTAQVYPVREQTVPSSVQKVFEKKEAEYSRQRSAVSTASSASSSGCFSHSGGGSTGAVKVDVYESPDRKQKVYVYNSQETGEHEICKVTGKPLSQLSKEEKDAYTAYHSSTLKHASASGLDVKVISAPSSGASTLSSTSPLSSRSSESGHRDATDSNKRPVFQIKASQKSVSTQPVAVQSARNTERAQVSRTTKMNGQAEDSTKMNGQAAGSANKPAGAAKSVIKISSNSVTIISSGKDGASAPKVTTTPLRRGNDDLPPKGSVSQRKKDTEFITALSQKLQVNGPSSHTPSAYPNPSSRGSASSLSDKAASPGDSGADTEKPPSATNTETSNRSSQVMNSSSVRNSSQASLLAEMKSTFQPKGGDSTSETRQTSGTEHTRQQVPSDITPPPPPPPVMVNGHAEGSLSVNTNGQSGRSNGQSSPGQVPPAPPPPKAPDASFASSRPKTLSTQPAVANGSIPSSPRSAGVTPEHQKMELMAALQAVVKSGSPSQSLRKTSGPNSGGVREVFSSKKSSGSSTPTLDKQANGGVASTQSTTPAALKQSNTTPTDLPSEFDWKNFLEQVPQEDSSGNKMPQWKREMKAKTMAQKAYAEYQERKKVEDYEARFANVPAWKRALIEKKTGMTGPK